MKVGYRLFPKEHIDYLKMNALFKTQRQMAQELGLSTTTISYHIRKNHIIVGKRKRIDRKYPLKITHDNLGNLLEDYVNSFLTLKQLGKKYNVHFSTISKLLTEHFFFKKLSDNTKIITLHSKL